VEDVARRTSPLVADQHVTDPIGDMFYSYNDWSAR